MKEKEIDIVKEYGELCIKYRELCRWLAEYEIGTTKIEAQEMNYLEKQREGMKVYLQALCDRLENIYHVDNPYETYLLIYGG